MIILEGGSRPEKQDEAPPLPASLPPQFFGAVLPRTLQKYPMRPLFLPRFDSSQKLPAWPAAGGLPARQDTVRAGVLAGAG